MINFNALDLYTDVLRWNSTLWRKTHIIWWKSSNYGNLISSKMETNTSLSSKTLNKTLQKLTTDRWEFSSKMSATVLRRRVSASSRMSEQEVTSAMSTRPWLILIHNYKSHRAHCKTIAKQSRRKRFPWNTCYSATIPTTEEPSDVNFKLSISMIP